PHERCFDKPGSSGHKSINHFNLTTCISKTRHSMMRFLKNSYIAGIAFVLTLPTVSAQTEPDQFRFLGKYMPRMTREIKSSTWSIGGETLDRDYTDYQSYKYYLD